MNNISKAEINTKTRKKRHTQVRDISLTLTIWSHFIDTNKQ